MIYDPAYRSCRIIPLEGLFALTSKDLVMTWA